MCLKKKHPRYKRYSQKRMQAIIKRYKMMKGCVLCGYKKSSWSLHCDHINPDEKHPALREERRGVDYKRMTWEEIKHEVLVRCQILCANCHGERCEAEEHSNSYKHKSYMTLNKESVGEAD